MQGWIKLYRVIKQKPIWLKSTPEQKAILVTLLLMANHESNEWEWQGEKFSVNPGQFITSLDSIVKEAGKGITIQNVRSALVRFEKLQFLTNKSTKTGRLITIENWELYQCDDVQPNKDTNKEVTKTQQRGNKEVTPNKNDKNDKNEKKSIYAEFVSLKESEYQKLLDEHGEMLVKKFIETLNNYKGANGKKYKSDYLAILNWVVEKVKKNTLVQEVKRPNSNIVVADEEWANMMGYTS